MTTRAWCATAPVALSPLLTQAASEAKRAATHVTLKTNIGAVRADITEQVGSLFVRCGWARGREGIQTEARPEEAWDEAWDAVWVGCACRCLRPPGVQEPVVFRVLRAGFGSVCLDSF